MSNATWRLLETFTDQPSAQALADVLGAEGIATRLISDASVLGQAAPTRLFVEASQLSQAHWQMSQRNFTDQELTFLSTGELPGED